MAPTRSIWSLFAPVLSIFAVAAISGLALHAVATDAAAHELKVTTLESRLLMLEDELADQATEIELLQKKHTRPKPVARKGRPDPDAVYAIPIGDAPVRGAADAPITLVEYTDFQCPFCKRVQPTITQLEERYGDQLRVVFKHHPLPFHKQAEPAAIAADCAGAQGHFVEMENLLWQNQRALSEENLRAYADSLPGLRLAEWLTCVADDDAKERVKSDTAEAIRFGSLGTPGFFLNGRFLSGAQPFERFTSLIDEELARFRKSEVPAARYYQEHVIARGLPRVE